MTIKHLEWEEGDFNIITRSKSKHSERNEERSGYFNDVFGIYYHEYVEKWIITHIPSGALFEEFPSMELAMDCCDYMVDKLKINWYDKSLHQNEIQRKRVMKQLVEFKKEYIWSSEKEIYE